GRQPGGRETLHRVLPEPPDRGVDAADRSRVGDVGAQQLPPADLLAAVGGAGRVAVAGEVVLHGALGIADPQLQEVDHLLLAAVLQHLEAGDRDRDRGLAIGYCATVNTSDGAMLSTS